MFHARLDPGAGSRAFEPAYAPDTGGSVFPRHSARVAKETVAVLALVLVGAALVMLATLLPADLFGTAPASAGCATLDRLSLFSPWCTAWI